MANNQNTASTFFSSTISIANSLGSYLLCKLSCILHKEKERIARLLNQHVLCLKWLVLYFNCFHIPINCLNNSYIKWLIYKMKYLVIRGFRITKTYIKKLFCWMVLSILFTANRFCLFLFYHENFSIGTYCKFPTQLWNLNGNW